MPKKSRIDAVLNTFMAAGNGLVSVLSGLLAAALVLYSGYVLYDTMYTTKQADSAWDLMQYRPEIIDDGSVPLSGSQLAAINGDYRAWITLYDTKIDYPVLQGSNDLFYASHDVYKKSSLTGSIYLAAANSPDFSDSYNLIYGHHMDGDVMFGTLDHYTDEGYLKTHKTGVIVSQDRVFDLEVIAVILTDAYAAELYTPGGDQMADVMEFIQEGIGDSTVYFDSVAAEGASAIVALSTCESSQTNGRLVVVARMDPRQGLPGKDTSSKDGGSAPNDPSDPASSSPSNPASGGSPGTPGTGSSGTAGSPGTNSIQGTDTQSERITASELITSSETAIAEEYAELDDLQTPLANLFRRFQPTGGSFGLRVWALLNLICLIITLYLLLPIMHVKAKFRRKKQMLNVNGLYDEEKEEDVYNTKSFVRRFRTGLVLEIIVCVLAVIAFILTEDIRLPMVLIDRWTPLMILLLLICWILDVRLIRYRSKSDNEERDTESRAA